MMTGKTGEEHKTIGSPRKGRERLSSALQHREPDRVPLTLGSPSCSLHASAQANLLAYLGLSPEPPIVTDHILQIVRTDERLLELFDIDMLWLLPEEAAVEWTAGDDAFVDSFGRRFIAGGGFFNQVGYPLQGNSREKLKSYSFPALEPARFAHLGNEARRLHAMGYGLGIDGPWGLYEISTSLMGVADYLMALISEPDLARKIAEKVLEHYLIPFYDLLLADTAPYIQVVGISDDLGSQTGMIFSPKMYREFFKPLHEQLIAHIHAISDARVYMHSDGSIYPVIPDLIEIGVEGLNPIQYDARDMGLARLKQEFGQDLGFFGGAVANKVLSFGSPDEVCRIVEENVATLKPGGGFLFAPIHNISQETPPENIVALYQAGREYGQY